MKRRGDKIFFLLIAVFLVLALLYQYFLPKRFVWKETYGRYDRQPFGSYVFDDVVSSSVGDYQVVGKTIFQYYYDSQEEYEAEEEEGQCVAPLPPEKRRALLVTNRSIPFSDSDMTALMCLLRQGNKAMLCLENFPYSLRDSFYFREASRYIPEHIALAEGIEQYVADGYRRDSLLFGADALHPAHVYEVYPHMHRYILRQEIPSGSRKGRIPDDSPEPLAYDNNGDTVALRFRVGEGELFLVSTPLMFTNYGTLDGNNASYAFRLLSYMKGMPLIRLDSYRDARGTGAATPLRYIMKEPPLRWAFFAALAVILLFMVFTAKRRQRAIPFVCPPANESLRFTLLVANLYYQRKDYRDMLRKKYLHFCAELKRTEGLDLQSDERDETLCRRLAEKMRQEYAAVWPAFRELKYLLRDEARVDEDDMTGKIDLLNKWKQFLLRDEQ
jgi:hypothetical protein